VSRGRRPDARASVALCVLALVMAGCGGRGPQPAASPAAASPVAASPAPTRTFSPITLRSNKVGSKYIYLTKQKNNRRVYTLRADAERGEYFGQDTGRSDFTNPHVTFYDVNGKTIVADAPRGTVLEKDKNVLMSGGVKARTDSGMTLSCDTLRYNDVTQKLHGEGNVVLRSPDGEELRGDRLDADVRLSNVHVTGTPGGPP
jgi:LPS export ABC transporter protein LptC